MGPLLATCCPWTNVADEYTSNASRIEQLKPHLLKEVPGRFGRLLLHWHEVKPSGRRLTHSYALCVDTQEWGIYLDCRPSKIFYKCVIQLLLRPWHALIKTAYHISMVPIFFELKKGYQKEQDGHLCFKNSFRSIADIVRTPIYSVAIIATTVAVLIVSAVSPQFIYTGRSWIGKIEQMGSWGEKHAEMVLAPCFQPFSFDIFDTDKYGRRYSDTNYPDADELEVRLGNFTRSVIRYQRNRTLGNCFMKLNKNVEYTSPILKDLQEKESAKIQENKLCSSLQFCD